MASKLFSCFMFLWWICEWKLSDGNLVLLNVFLFFFYSTCSVGSTNTLLYSLDCVSHLSSAKQSFQVKEMLLLQFSKFNKEQKKIGERVRRESSLWGGNSTLTSPKNLVEWGGGKKINDTRQWIFYPCYTPKVKYVSCSCSMMCKMCLDLTCKHCWGAYKRCM